MTAPETPILQWMEEIEREQVERHQWLLDAAEAIRKQEECGE